MSKWIEKPQDIKPTFAQVDAAVMRALESREIFLPSFSLTVADLAAGNGLGHLVSGDHPIKAVLRDERRLLVEYILKRLYGGNARGLYECIQDSDRTATPNRYIKMVEDRLEQSYEALRLNEKSLMGKAPFKVIERKAIEFVQDNYPQYVGQVVSFTR